MTVESGVYPGTCLRSCTAYHSSSLCRRRMLNLPGSRRKRTRRTRLTILQSSSPRRQHEFREISNPSPHADAPNSQEHPFDLETSLQEASYASDQPEPSLSGLAANTDLESISRGVIRQSHLTRKQNEEENYQAFRPKALETFNKASCQQVLTDRYKGLSDYTKDFTQKCTQVCPTPAYLHS